jgi:hypothetical protein
MHSLRHTHNLIALRLLNCCIENADSEYAQKAKGETMADKVKWQFNVPDADEALLAKCRCWAAELAYKDVYSEGLVFIKESGKSVPAYFGYPQVTLPEPRNLIRLIEQVSQAMVAGLTCSWPCECKCQNVHVVSLNEGDFEKVQRNEKASLGVHFRLLPRYQHDEYFLKRINDDGTDNDGFALMAEWRKQFQLREKTGRLPDFQKPREKPRWKWRESAERIREKLKKAVEESQKCC